MDHLQLDATYRGNLTYVDYGSGHMLYVNLPDLKQMQRDLEAFIHP